MLTDLSALLAKRFGKPEKGVRTCLVADQALTFSGTLAPAAFAVVKNVGKMTPDDTTVLSRELAASKTRAEAMKWLPAGRALGPRGCPLLEVAPCGRCAAPVRRAPTGR